MNAKEYIEKEENAIFYCFDSTEKAFTLEEVVKWMEGYAKHKLASDGDLADVRLSSEKIDELWDNFSQDVPDDPERVLAMRGTRIMKKSRFLDAVGSLTDEA